MYGFCPGKATWDHDAANLFSLIELAFFTRSLAFTGSLFEQPSWYVDIIATYLPLYDQMRFNQRMKAMWGSDTAGASKSPKKAPKRGRR